MGYQNHGSPEFSKIGFQPADHFLVQMVGRLVQNQDIRRKQQSPRQGHPFLLPAGQGLDPRLRIRDAQGIQHIFRIVLGDFATCHTGQHRRALGKGIGLG